MATRRHEIRGASVVQLPLEINLGIAAPNTGFPFLSFCAPGIPITWGAHDYVIHHLKSKLNVNKTRSEQGFNHFQMIFPQNSARFLVEIGVFLSLLIFLFPSFVSLPRLTQPWWFPFLASLTNNRYIVQNAIKIDRALPKNHGGQT
jgi:hypothetical protein